MLRPLSVVNGHLRVVCTRGLAVLVAAAAMSAGVMTPVPSARAEGTRYLDVMFTDVMVTRNAPYATAPNLITGAPQPLAVDIYQPAGDTATNRAVLVWVHGGGFSGGSKGQMAEYQSDFTLRGYVSIAVEYRLDTGNRCQDVQDGLISDPAEFAVESARCERAIAAAQSDTQAAVRAIRANAAALGVDRNRIGIVGFSAGAITAINIGTRSDDPGTVGEDLAQPSSVRAVVASSGCSYSPEVINANDAPMYLSASEFDSLVPFDCVRTTQARAQAVGVPVTTQYFLGESAHASALYRKYFAESLPQWVEFLYANVIPLQQALRVAAGSVTVIRGEPNRSGVVSLVATDSTGWGFLQVLDCAVTPGATSNLNVDAAAQTRAGLAIVRFGADGRSCVYSSVATHLVVDVQGYLAADAFDDQVDVRLLDSRSGARPGSGSVTVIRGEPNRSGVVSLVATDSTGWGFLQVLDCAVTPGATSNLNVDAAAQTWAGLAIVRFGADGRACVYSSVATHLVVDVQGYLAADAFDDQVDVRLLDSRSGARPGSGSVTVIRGEPNRSGVVSLVATDSTGWGYLQVFDCATTPGETSNLNVDRSGQTIAGLSIVKFGPDGRACVFTQTSTHLVVDVQGYLAADAFDDQVDVRVFDSRS